MHRYGLIGRKLGHSFSKKHFTAVFRKAGLKDHRYDLYELPEIEALPDLLRRTPGLHGRLLDLWIRAEVARVTGIPDLAIVFVADLLEIGWRVLKIVEAMQMNLAQIPFTFAMSHPLGNGLANTAGVREP